MTQDPVRETLEAALQVGWGSLLALGIVQALLGTVAIAAPQIATLVGIEFLGGILCMAGLAQAVWAFRVRSWRGFALTLFGALLNGGAGVALLLVPGDAAVAITLLLAAVLIVDGVARTALAVRSGGGHGRRWLLPAGLAGIALGVLLWWEWPSDAVWAVGLLLGTNLFLGGVALAALALASRGGSPPAAAA